MTTLLVSILLSVADPCPEGPHVHPQFFDWMAYDPAFVCPPPMVTSQSCAGAEAHAYHETILAINGRWAIEYCRCMTTMPPGPARDDCLALNAVLAKDEALLAQWLYEFRMYLCCVAVN